LERGRYPDGRSRLWFDLFRLFFSQQFQEKLAFCGIVFGFDEINVVRDVLALDELFRRLVHGAPSQPGETTAGSRGRRKRYARELPPSAGDAGGSSCAFNDPFGIATGSLFDNAPFDARSRAIFAMPDTTDGSKNPSFHPSSRNSAEMSDTGH
jgi:hypothetical protein